MTKKENSFPESHELEDVIKQILEIDANARNLTENAMKSRVDAEQEIVKKSQELHNIFMERAKHRIELLKAEEDKLAGDALSNADILVDKNLTQLNKIAEEKSEGWINEIYKSIVEI